MKRSIAAVIALSLSVCTLSACGENKSSKAESSEEKTAAASEETSTESDSPDFTALADDIRKSGNAVAMDMSASGMNVSGKHIVSDYSDYNTFKEGFEYFWLAAHISDYCADADNYAWLILIDEGEVKCAAVASSDTSEDVEYVFAHGNEHIGSDLTGCSTIAEVADKLNSSYV